jgi:integrase
MPESKSGETLGILWIFRVHVALMLQHAHIWRALHKTMAATMAKVRRRTWKTGDTVKTAWIADYFDQAGKRHLKTFSTRKAADAWLVTARHEISQGVHTPASTGITVGEAGDLWIAQAESDGLERSTLEQYRQHLEYHIKPLIGAVRLAELSPGMVQSFRNNLIAGARSRVMAKKVLGSLGALIANAMTAGKAVRNVVREQGRETRRQNRLDKRHTKRLQVGVDIPSKDEIRAILARAQGRYRPLLVTAIFTGLRASELRGLRWDDVDLDRAELTVRQRADRWGSIGSPKSDAGKRTVPLAPVVVNTLREWRLACPKSAADLVFPNGKGRPEQLTAIHYRGLGPLQHAAGIADTDKPKYGMHAFRHAAASLFIEQGFSPKRVQALMGHSSIQMTFDTYGHLFPAPEDDQAAMRQLQARLIG